MNKYLFSNTLNSFQYLLLFIFLPFLTNAQNCGLKITGVVTDASTKEPLEDVHIYINEIKKGVVSNSDGSFEVKNLCAGACHIVFSHVGCASEQQFIQLKKDTVLNLKMEHAVDALHSIVINSNQLSTQKKQTLNEQNITDNSNQNLANVLSSITGVSTLKNGAGISKPVVQGLFGNRLTILNNGVAQSGQQWGNDHSPEIDPLVANKITVIKGVGALEYMGSNLGSVVIVSPKKITKEPHLHGKTTYFFESNGLSNGLNLQLEQYGKKVAWKVNGTLKKSGDRKAPDYYLNNTGNQEANIALQLEKSFSDKLDTDLYFSSFNTELGVLRGAHIGNANDLKEAFLRSEPFFTEPSFSYGIESPRQKVSHHLLKLHGTYFFNEDVSLEMTFAGQLNRRKEFDVRRNGRSNRPALSLEQFNYFFESKLKQELENGVVLKSGIQLNYIDNTNIPETNISSLLIPDYLSYEGAVFVTGTKRTEKSLFELGARYHIVSQNGASINSSKEIVRFDNYFQNFSSSGGWSYQINEKFNFKYNVGYVQRNPAINELYSNGLHQGLASIERGNNSLDSEKSIKSTFYFSGKINSRFSFESLAYYQRIQDYIFLKPQQEVEQNTRGKFLVFGYDQTDAQIYGWEISADYEINSSLHSKISYSYLKGDDLINAIPLLNMPANSIDFHLGYEFSQPVYIGKQKLENLEIELNNQYVFRQKHIFDSQLQLIPDDSFVFAAPNAYNLLGLKAATNIQLHHSRLRLTAKIDNLLDAKYRDYLNRLRYFSDELGRNIIIGMSLKF